MADLDAEKAEAELRALLALAVDQRDRAAELDARMRLGALQVATGDAAAALEMVAAGQALLDEGVGDALAAGRLWYVAGQARARAGGDALAAFEEAVRRFRAAGSRVDALRARLRVVETLQAQRRIEAAVVELSGMIGDLKSWGADRGLADCHRMRAGLHALMARFDEASADYDRAVAAAERLGDAALALRLRIERRTVAPLGERSAARWEDWSALIADAEALGEAGAVGEVRLQQAASALRRDDFEAGLALAAAARQAALDGNQPVAYLMACLLIAEARMLRGAAGDDPAVIEVLLTCKVSLERRFGEAFGAPVVAVLDSLAPRWGEARFDAALAEYRRRAAARAG
ncbi:MAG: hypothetical protein R3F65_26235 [bacterium]